MKKALLGLTLFLSLLLVFSLSTGYWRISKSTTGLVFAEDEEDHEEKEEDHEKDEDEEEHEEEDEHDDGSGYSTEEVYVTEEAGEEYVDMVLAPQVTYVWVVDAGYDVDSDGDELVDALDPHPDVDERLLFTDSDGDTVPDAHDLWPDEDDYLYIEDFDENHNGVLDSHEQL